ncbi:MAG: hypothetical protein DYH06_10965 [Acidobacteria bacterium ACB2]|nr:hypothetical protein [Acidobacteria bacterium ACB2]
MPGSAARFALACLPASAAWIACEVGGGLLFLAAGLRLWRYEIAPLFLEITSPVVWALAAVLITPLTLAFERAAVRRLPGALARSGLRLAFLMVTGPLVEVVLNEALFRGLLGRPLYVYTFLPTFDGSGSLLSPFYYATLYLHVPVAGRLLGRRASGARRSASPASSTSRAPATSDAA